MKSYQVDENGFYGEFGGAYVPEILYKCVHDLQEAYLPIIESEAFKREYHALLKDYVGRPSPLYYAQRMSEQYGCKLYLKREDGLYQSVHNSATCYNKYGVTDLYHKSRLVPGVEKMPFPKLFWFLEDLVINLGGPRTSLSPDTAQHAFYTTINDGTVKVGTVICYESAYGEIFSDFVKDGAQLMAVITNDAWWGDTPGYKQHFLFSRLRAIESRRTVLRSSNPGISAFIDESGDVHQATKYNTRLAIKQNVYPNDYITFYTRHGDYLARIAVVLASICLLWTLLLWGIKLFHN